MDHPEPTRPRRRLPALVAAAALLLPSAGLAGGYSDQGYDQDYGAFGQDPGYYPQERDRVPGVTTFCPGSPGCASSPPPLPGYQAPPPRTVIRRQGQPDPSQFVLPLFSGVAGFMIGNSMGRNRAGDRYERELAECRQNQVDTDRILADIERREARLEERRDRLREVAEEVRSRAEEVRDRQREVEDRAEELEDRDHELDDREGELEDRDGRLDERARELDLARAEVDERDAELDDRARELDERGEELDERERELDEREEELEERRDHRRGHARERIAELEADLASLRDQLAERDVVLDRIRRRIRAHRCRRGDRRPRDHHPDGPIRVEPVVVDEDEDEGKPSGCGTCGHS